MKKLTVLIALLFSVMFSSTSFADWRKVDKGVYGDIFYVDFERIRKHDGYVYFWMLIDFLKPDEEGRLSIKGYIQGDCKLLGFKNLSESQHKEPMGGGVGNLLNEVDKNWTYPSPNSVNEYVLKTVCDYVN